MIFAKLSKSRGQVFNWLNVDIAPTNRLVLRQRVSQLGITVRDDTWAKTSNQQMHKPPPRELPNAC